MLNKYFLRVDKKIAYKEKDSKNSFSFRYSNKDCKAGSKTMADHLRFAAAYWHTFMNSSHDIALACETFYESFKNLTGLDKWVSSNDEPGLKIGQQESLDNIVNSHIL